jgi:alpha-beta hydrolase superfamily lysophospholipase
MIERGTAGVNSGHTRTFRQIVYELHTLLERAGERAPFILIGHSYGAWLGCRAELACD